MSRALAGISPAVLYTILGICGVVMLYPAFWTSLALVGVLLTCMLMLLFAVYLAQWVMAKDEGTVDMQEVCLLCHLPHGCVAQASGQITQSALPKSTDENYVRRMLMMN